MRGEAVAATRAAPSTSAGGTLAERRAAHPPDRRGQDRGAPPDALEPRVAVVAGEQLVPAVAGERDGDLRAGQPADTRCIGISEMSPKGSSQMSGNSGTTSSASASVTASGVWSVPRCAATAAASADSSKARSAKPTVKVRTGRSLCCCMSATTMLESTPPERKAPTGTSATIRAATESERTDSSRSAMASTRPVERATAGLLDCVVRRPVGASRGVARRAGRRRRPSRSWPGEQLGDPPVDGVRRRHAVVPEVEGDRVAVDVGGETPAAQRAPSAPRRTPVVSPTQP